MPLRALASIKPADAIRPGAVRLSLFDQTTSQDVRVGLNAALQGSTNVPVVAKAFYDPRLGELVVAPSFNKSLARLRKQARALVGGQAEGKHRRGYDNVGVGVDVKEAGGAVGEQKHLGGGGKKAGLRQLRLERMVDDMGERWGRAEGEEGRVKRRIQRRGGRSNKSLRQIIRLETSQEMSALGRHFA